MTPAAKITYASALLIGLAVGLTWGFYSTTQDLDFYNDLMHLTAPSQTQHYADLQYTHADLTHAIAALQTFVKLLERMETLKPEKTQQGELAIAYARLALLEDQAHDEVQSQLLITRSRSWLAASGGRVYSDSEIRKWVERVDQITHNIREN